MSQVKINLDARVIAILKRFWNDRVGFVKHIIGATPQPHQVELLSALDKNDFVVVKSGVNTGKSTTEAWSILHYICCRPECRILCSSPSKDQLYGVLWSELNLWYKQMNPLFRDMFVWTKTAFTHVEHPHWYAHARTATKDNPRSLAGIHAKYVYRIIDEASSVHDDNFDVIEGNTGSIETKELLCSNPTSLSGTFYEAFHKNMEQYRLFTWNSLDYLQSKGGLVPDRVVERMRSKYGEDSNIWRALVTGEFPSKSGNSYIPFDWVVGAIGREIADQSKYQKVFGIDVGDGGEDDSVIAIRQNDLFHPYHILKGKRTAEVTTYAAMLANKEKPAAIFVDIIGYGKAVYDGLERLGFNVIGVNVAETSSMVDPKRFHRLRDELWGTMRDWLEMKCGRLWDNGDRDLLGELTTPKYHILDGSGKIRLQSKDDFRDEITKKKVPSTNIADAHLLAFAQPVNSYAGDDEFVDGYEEGAMAYAYDEEAGYVWLMPFLALMGGLNG